jgi:hypothetical protein
MGVLAVTHGLSANGAAWCLCRLAVAITEAGGQCDVLHHGGESLAEYLREHGVTVVDHVNSGDYDVALVNTLLDHRRVVQLAAAIDDRVPFPAAS